MYLDQLSNREFEVNEHIARGNSVKEIASKLFLSPYTIDTHIKNIKKKTGAKNMADLTRGFILSLDNPKQFFKSTVSLFFLGVHITVSLFTTDIDFKRPRVNRTRINKTARRIDA